MKEECISELIISLTSYPKRIDVVYKTIQSLLNQSIQPNKIILWLAEEEFQHKENDLPNSLLDLRNNIFEIKWCNNIRSYKKLIPALKLYPNNIIITCDDDVIYEKNCIELLYNAYKSDSGTIWCHRGHYITFDKNKTINPYKKWMQCTNYNTPSYNILQTGVGAVLYPPNCFYKDILNSNLFMDLAYDTDDLWFWAMAVLNNTKIGIVKNNISYINQILEDDVNALFIKNIELGNDNNLSKLFAYYPGLKRKLKIKIPIYFYFHKMFDFAKTQTHLKFVLFGLNINLKRGKRDV